MVLRHYINTHHTSPHPRKHTPRPHPYQRHHPPTNAQPTPSPFALAHNRHISRPMEYTMPEHQYYHNIAYLNSRTSHTLQPFTITFPSPGITILPRTPTIPKQHTRPYLHSPLHANTTKHSPPPHISPSQTTYNSSFAGT